jgi:hypothetical protein
LLNRVDEIRFKTIERLKANELSSLCGIDRNRLRIFHHGLPLLAGFDGRSCVGPVNIRINRSAAYGAIKRHHVVQQGAEKFDPVPLALQSAAQITAERHPAANRTANQSVLVQLALYEDRINMTRVLNQELNGIESHFLIEAKSLVLLFVNGERSKTVLMLNFIRVCWDQGSKSPTRCL